MATNIVSGHGGWIKFYETIVYDAQQEREDEEEDPDLPVTYDPVTINIDTWVGRWSCEYIAATPSGMGNGTLFLPTLAINTWEASFPLDTASDHTYDATDPYAINGFINTFFPGMPIYEIYFRRGNETWEDDPPTDTFSVYDRLERTTLIGIQFVDDNKGDAVRVMLAGMGGILTMGYTESNTP